MPPLSLQHVQRELDLAIRLGRYFKLFATRMPAGAWAQQASRGYSRINRSYRTKDPSPEDVAALQQQLADSVGTWMDGDGKDLSDQLSQMITDAHLSNANFGGQLALGKLGISGSFNLTNPTALGELAGVSRFTTELVDTSTQQLIGQALTQSVAAGLDMNQTADLIQSMVGDRWTDLSSGRSRLIADTEVCRATSWASQETYDANGIELEEWATTGDDKTCDDCDLLDGEQFPTDGSGHDPPPEHPDCRCTLEPVIPDSWERPVGDDAWVGGDMPSEEGGGG